MDTYAKTLVSCDHYYKKPSFLHRLQIRIWKGKLVFNKNKGCWEEKYIVKGFIERGWFYPNFLQSINYKIYWPYGQKEINTEDFVKNKELNDLIQKILATS